jgi:ribosomal protein L7/L12
MPYPWLDSSEERSMSNLAVRIQDRRAKLVVVDNLGVVSGDAEENSGDMGKVMSLWRQLAEDTGAAIVLIHHQRKGNGLAGRAGDSLRGHSSIEASLDLALLIEREEYSDTVNIKATKVRGPDVLPFSAAFTYEHDQNGELSQARFFGISSEDNQSGAAIEREILVTLLNTSLNKTELTKAVKEILPAVGLNRIRDMIDRLEKNGKLKINRGDRTEKLYSQA